MEDHYHAGRHILKLIDKDETCYHHSIAWNLYCGVRSVCKYCYKSFGDDEVKNNSYR